MTSIAQKNAIHAYRNRLAERGVARFEVQAPASDREMIRLLARKLTRENPGATELRRIVQQAIAGEPAPTGGIVASLRRSPLVGADLDFSRPREPGRKVEF